MPPMIEQVPLEVRELFDRLAHELIKRGWEHYSSDAILHRIRWHFHVERGLRDYKCNDHWTAYLARWWLKNNPNHPDFFELRVLKNGKWTAEKSEEELCYELAEKCYLHKNWYPRLTAADRDIVRRTLNGGLKPYLTQLQRIYNKLRRRTPNND